MLAATETTPEECVDDSVGAVEICDILTTRSASGITDSDGVRASALATSVGTMVEAEEEGAAAAGPGAEGMAAAEATAGSDEGAAASGCEGSTAIGSSGILGNSSTFVGGTGEAILMSCWADAVTGSKGGGTSSSSGVEGTEASAASSALADEEDG